MGKLLLNKAPILSEGERLVLEAALSRLQITHSMQ
jgi:peptidoglycan-associated lipoprotein